MIKVMLLNLTRTCSRNTRKGPDREIPKRTQSLWNILTYHLFILLGAKCTFKITANLPYWGPEPLGYGQDNAGDGQILVLTFSLVSNFRTSPSRYWRPTGHGGHGPVLLRHERITYQRGEQSKWLGQGVNCFSRTLLWHTGMEHDLFWFDFYDF